jgi:PUA domain protein
MVSGVNNPKSSVQRGIRQSILDNYPAIITYLDSIIPKKGDLKIVKWYENIVQWFRGIYKVISKN